MEDKIDFESIIKNGLYELIKTSNLSIIQDFYERNKKSRSLKLSPMNELAFYACCLFGKLEIAKWLLTVRPNIETSINYECALSSACKNGYLEIIEWLLLKKPYFNVQKLFIVACFNNHHNIAKYLFSYKNTINVSDSNNAAFISAINNGNFEFVKWLVEIYPSNLNKVERDYFCVACKNGYFDIAK